MVASGYVEQHDGGLSFEIRLEGAQARRLTSYFAAAAVAPVVNSSVVALRRDTAIEAGLFPEGIGMGEDQDTWCRIAWLGPVVLTPEVTAIYDRRVQGGAVARAAASRVQPLHPLLAGYPGNRRLGHPLVGSFDEMIVELAWSQLITAARTGSKDLMGQVFAHPCWPAVRRRHPATAGAMSLLARAVPMALLGPSVHFLTSRLFVPRVRTREGIEVRKFVAPTTTRRGSTKAEQ